MHSASLVARKLARPQSPRKRKETCYALVCKNSAILLVQRPPDASLMAGMWELPALLPDEVNGDAPLCPTSTFHHRYRLPGCRVCGLTGRLLRLEPDGRWLTRTQWERLPLTGLTRKILRRLHA